jgi:hypothetical protein
LRIGDFDRLNNETLTFRDYISDFIKELGSFLNMHNNVTYNIASDVNENNEYYVIERGRKGGNQMINANDLPQNATVGTVMRYINGNFVIDEKLTREKVDAINLSKKETEQLVNQYKQEGVDYFIKSKDEEGFWVKNESTGLLFPLSKYNDITKAEYETWQENMILNFENGSYVIKGALNE